MAASFAAIDQLLLDVAVVLFARDSSGAITGARVVFHGGSGRDDDPGSTFVFGAPVASAGSLTFTSTPLSGQPTCRLLLDRRNSGAFEVTGSFQHGGSAAYPVCGAASTDDGSSLTLPTGCGLITEEGLPVGDGIWRRLSGSGQVDGIGAAQQTGPRWAADSSPLLGFLAVRPNATQPTPYDALNGAPVATASNGMLRLGGALFSAINESGGPAAWLVIEKGPGATAGLRIRRSLGAAQETACMGRAPLPAGQVDCSLPFPVDDQTAGVWWGRTGALRIPQNLATGGQVTFFPFTSGPEGFGPPVQAPVTRFDGGFSIATTALAGRYVLDGESPWQNAAGAAAIMGGCLAREGAARRLFACRDSFANATRLQGEAYLDFTTDIYDVDLSQSGGDLTFNAEGLRTVYGSTVWEGRVSPAADLRLDATLHTATPPDGGATALRLRELADGGYLVTATRSGSGIAFPPAVLVAP